MSDPLAELNQLIKSETIKWTVATLEKDLGDETKSATAYLGTGLEWSLTVVSFRLCADPDTIRCDGAAANIRNALIVHLTPELAKLAAEQAAEKTF